MSKVKKAEAKQKEMEAKKAALVSKPDLEDDFFDVQDVGHGTEFAAVKPWMG